MAVEPTAVRLLLAAVGVASFWQAYRQYRKRRYDPNVPRDPVTDRWFRVLFRGLATGLGIPFVGTAWHAIFGSIPDVAFWPLTVATIAGILVFFTAAFVLGWRSA
jgi:hypothetical protein